MPIYAYGNPYEGQSGTIASKRIREAGFVERQFRTGSVALNYVIGPDSGPALVLLPAQMGMWESYSKVLAPLSRRFQVYAIDVRGHGKSSWTPGDYSWKSIGGDMEAFLKGAVKRPAILSGSSSGGIIALWCAANLPGLVSGIVLEDAPVFSAEMPRFKEKDRFVYNGLAHLVASIGDLKHRDIARYLEGQVMPVSEGRVKRVPGWLISLLSWRISVFQAKHPGQPIDLSWFPFTVRVFFKSLSMFDPDFARAFVDGRFYEGIDHAEALSRVTCPVLVLHASWRRYARYGLVGAMDDEDAARIKELAPQSLYKKIPANHVIHADKPERFVAAIEEFGAAIAT